MADQIYQDSNYRFTDPIRFFKANDPYYFEVDNIPLKQLQENCNWLRDQVRKDSSQILNVKRSDLEELRPYATGEDRIVRVKPGRYSARINDASNKEPLAYLEKVMGTAVGDVDAWSTALPNPGNFTGGKNAVLQAALDTFKTAVASEAKGMTGLAERAFTWPVINSDTPIDNDGVDLENGMGYGGPDVNIPGGGASYSPMVISQALVWAKSQGSTAGQYALPSFEITNPNNGWAKFPRTESYFIKAWRGVSRLAVVDVDDEITIEVPGFDPDDFAYTNSDGSLTQVTGVESRVDLVFIYSKPVDSSGVTILKPEGKQTITKPQLGIVRGAGIRTNFQETTDFTKEYMQNVGDDHSILAHPGDQKNTDMGFNSTSANDIAVDVRGTFPSPDDILNLAPLISEKLEDNAYELIGQSILPVAYIWVQNSSQVVLSTDVIDIRPLFRTAELAYNERAGIGAAFPQLSLANPAVGKGQLDYELRRVYEDLKGRVDVVAGQSDTQSQMNTLATGYVFGGWNFGPEGALFNYYQSVFAEDESDSNDGQQYIKQYVVSKYGYGNTVTNFSIPSYPDWDLSQWCIEQDIDSKGLYPNDYINTFISTNAGGGENDPSIVAGSFKDLVNPDGTSTDGVAPTQLNNFTNTDSPQSDSSVVSKVNFNYVAKKIKFNRPSWLADYKVDVDLVNCLAQAERGHWQDDEAGSYFGHWVEKGFDEFVIYVAFSTDDNNHRTTTGVSTPAFPAPHTLTYTTGGKKKKTTHTLNVSERGGNRFSGFVVPVADILYSNTSPVSDTSRGGYVGNPRIGKCTYPTVMWSMTGVPVEDAPFLYGNLNGTNPTITLKS
jgi:hypothetical protein